MIEYLDTAFSYSPEKPVIPPLRGRWEKGLIHSLIGPSGCGKSTLLYLIAGLIQPSRGEILIQNETPRPGRRQTAVILQNHGLFPWKTAWQNLALGLEIRREKKGVIQDKITRVLKDLGLEGKEHSYPKEMSGGERQRLGIGRSLVLDPDLLLLDEPFSSLDAMTRERLQDNLWQLKHNRLSEAAELTVVLVTHSIEEAVFLSDRIHIMDDQGFIRSLSNTTSGPGGRMESSYFDTCVLLRKQFGQHAQGGL
ncbi:ABC transporter ATP-binding protein [Oceanispirochaeta sp.]|uniref:ABC transporter ATP-binding protein n=1 Tax=Oceanispirochaeta sp. TaxID=2035350 RepID=UPI0026366D46|nr:ATP-binding cassette domain-containing protein [Oceanispirochaeta sp.]MDA3956748.1 ATP-binding cassette domain-containing protein [Oceanispirochaeta sp.]